MVQILAFTNNFLIEIIFSTDKVFYKTIDPGRVSVTIFGFVELKTET